MLLSCVFILEADQEAVVPFTNGRASHAAFLKMVGDLDAMLAWRLHNQGRGKPFTVSPLWGVRKRQDDGFCIQAGREYWLRFTSLDPMLSALLSMLTPQQIGSFNLAEATFSVRRILTTREAHSWAGQCSYESFYDNWFSTGDSPSRKFKLSFITPTSFRSGRRNFLFPLPHLVFFSLVEKWKQYAPTALGMEAQKTFDEICGLETTDTNSGELMRSKSWALLNNVVSVTRYNLRTRVRDFTLYKQLGFTGEAEFEIHAAVERWSRLLHLLAEFAFYAGVGYKTTMGMGQSRRVVERLPA